MFSDLFYLAENYSRKEREINSRIKQIVVDSTKMDEKLDFKIREKTNNKLNLQTFLELFDNSIYFWRDCVVFEDFNKIHVYYDKVLTEKEKEEKEEKLLKRIKSIFDSNYKFKGKCFTGKSYNSNEGKKIKLGELEVYFFFQGKAWTKPLYPENFKHQEFLHKSENFYKMLTRDYVGIFYNPEERKIIFYNLENVLRGLTNTFSSAILSGGNLSSFPLYIKEFIRDGVLNFFSFEEKNNKELLNKIKAKEIISI